MKMRIVLLALISFCFLSVNAADKKKNYCCPLKLKRA